MSHLDEPMDIDDMDLGFDNKENTYHHSNVLRNACTEKEYEELDVSELNMKLRYSVTPASSPLSKSSISNSCSYKKTEIDDTLSKTLKNDNSNSINFTNSTITNRDITINVSKATPPHECHFYNSLDSRNMSVLQPLDSTVTVACINANGLNNSDENFLFPSSSSSTAHTSEATTPTKEIPKIESGSPIMRGLKSVLNMFRSSQSPIPPESENKLQIECQNNLEICSPQSSTTHESASVNILASTPIVSHRIKESQSKGNSPHKDSVVFHDDLEKDLLWKDETTIIFSKEKIPIHKLFFQQQKPSILNGALNENKNHNANVSINSTAEYMDITNNDSTITDKTITEILVNENNVVESDSEFQDCETTFTKNEDQLFINKKIDFQIPVERPENMAETKSENECDTVLAENKFNNNNFTEQQVELVTNVSKPCQVIENILEGEVSDTIIQSKVICESEIQIANEEIDDVNRNNHVECCKINVSSVKILDEQEFINELEIDLNTSKTNVSSKETNIEKIKMPMCDIPVCVDTDTDINTSKTNVHFNIADIQDITNSDLHSKPASLGTDDEVPMPDMRGCMEIETDTSIKTSKNNIYPNMVKDQNVIDSNSHSLYICKPVSSESKLNNKVPICDVPIKTDTDINKIYYNMDEVQDMTDSDSHSLYTCKPAFSETDLNNKVHMCDLHACIETDTSKNNVCSNVDEVEHETNCDLQSMPVSSAHFQDNVLNCDMCACTETKSHITSNLILDVYNTKVDNGDSSKNENAENACLAPLKIPTPLAEVKDTKVNKANMTGNKNTTTEISFSDLKSKIILDVKDINDSQYLSGQNFKSGIAKELYTSEEEIDSKLDNLDLNLNNADIVVVDPGINKCEDHNNVTAAVDNNETITADIKMDVLSDKSKVENVTNFESQKTSGSYPQPNFQDSMPTLGMHTEILDTHVTSNLIFDNTTLGNKDILHNLTVQEVFSAINPVLVPKSLVQNKNNHEINNTFESLSQMTSNPNPTVTCFSDVTKIYDKQSLMDLNDCKSPITEKLATFINKACENYNNVTDEVNGKESFSIDIKMDNTDRDWRSSYNSEPESDFKDDFKMEEINITSNLIPNVDNVIVVNTDFVNNVIPKGACPEPSLFFKPVDEGKDAHKNFVSASQVTPNDNTNVICFSDVDSKVLFEVKDTIVTEMNITPCLIDQNDCKLEKSSEALIPKEGLDSKLDKLDHKEVNGDINISNIDPGINNDCKNYNNVTTQVYTYEKEEKHNLTVTPEVEIKNNNNVSISQLGKSGQPFKESEKEIENLTCIGSAINNDKELKNFRHLSSTIANVVTEVVDSSTKYTDNNKEQSIAINTIDTEKIEELDVQNTHCTKIVSHETCDTTTDTSSKPVSNAVEGFAITCNEKFEGGLKNINLSITSMHDSFTRSIPTSKNVFNLPEIQDVRFSQSLIKSKYQFDKNNLDEIDTEAKCKLGDSIASFSKDIKHENHSLHNKSETTHVQIEQTLVLGNHCNDSSCEIAYNDKEHVADSSITITSSKTTKAQEVQENHTDDEDTVEGPFLETDDSIERNKTLDFGRASDLMQFSELPLQDNECAGEFFIDAEAYEFLMNKNNDEILEHGKESLFLKFDPLFARKMTSDGVVAALNDFRRRQSTPKKISKMQLIGQKYTELTHEEPFIPDHLMTDAIHSALNCTAEESTVDFNATVCKPTMAVSPAVNPVLTPRNMPSTPSKVNRHSLTFTSPAMTVIDKLLSLSPKNNSIVLHDTTNNTEQNEATEALIQLREVLSEKVLENQHIKSESKELRSRLTTLESQIKVLEDESDDRLKKIKILNEQLTDKTKINKSMSTVVEEYEKAISTLISETEQEKKLHAEERIKLITERNEQTAHLASMEVSFNDLHSKYEKSKQMIMSYKASEDIYKKSLKEFDESCAKLQSNYDQLKQHATLKLNQANEELEKIKRAHNSEVLKLNAMIKRKELFITSIEENLAQKTKANEELTAICDELINKVG